MISPEISAKTVEEALDEGIKKLGVKRENVKMEILNEPSQGLLKFLGSKPAKIRLTVKREPEEYIKDFLENIIRIIGLQGDVLLEANEDDTLSIIINGKDLGLLIGKRGNTLKCSAIFSQCYFSQAICQ